MGLLGGARAFAEGVRWVLTTPRVWLRALAPVATALVLIAALGGLGIRWAMTAAHHTFGTGMVAASLGAVLAIAAVVLAIVVGVSLAQPLSGWALAGIVDAVRRDLGLAPERQGPLLPATLRSLASALLEIAVGVPLIALLTVATWVFPPDAVVTVPAKALVAASLLAWDLLDYPLSSHGLDLGARLRWCWRNAGAVLGFGLASLLFFAIPGLGLVVLPCGVAGATRLVADCERAAPHP